MSKQVAGDAPKRRAQKKEPEAKSQTVKNVRVEETDPRPIWIEWVDSISYTDGWGNAGGYVHDSIADKVMVHYTLGYLIHESDDFVLIAPSVSHSGHGHDHIVRDALQVPKVAITDRAWITEPHGAQARRDADP